MCCAERVKSFVLVGDAVWMEKGKPFGQANRMARRILPELRSPPGGPGPGAHKNIKYKGKPRPFFNFCFLGVFVIASETQSFS